MSEPEFLYSDYKRHDAWLDQTECDAQDEYERFATGYLNGFDEDKEE